MCFSIDYDETNEKKKKKFYKAKLKENIGKPKELLKPLQSLGLPCKKGSVSNICLKKDDKTSFDDKINANTFNEFFRNLASDLVVKLPPSSNEFGISSVRNYYQNILDLLPNKSSFSNVTEDVALKLLKDKNIDGANILAKPIPKIRNLSIKYSVFPTDCQAAKLRPLYKKCSTTLPKNYRPISLLP